MWIPLLKHGAAVIEGDERDGVWRFRRRTTSARNARVATTLGRPTHDLGALFDEGRGWMTRLQAAVHDLLLQARANVQAQGREPAWLLEMVGALDAEEQELTRRFEEGYFELRDRLRLMAEHVAHQRALNAASPETAFLPVTFDGPGITSLRKAIGISACSVLWGEAETIRRGNWRSEDNYEALLFGWRRRNVAELPFEDLDALVADRAQAFHDEHGHAWSSEPNIEFLLSLLPRIEALAPWANLARPHGPEVLVATFSAFGRSARLVRDMRRWGLALGDDDATMLPKGLGAGLAWRVAACPDDTQRAALDQDVILLAVALRHTPEPREPFTVFVHDAQEIQARWSLGTWQWRVWRLEREPPHARSNVCSSWERGAFTALLPWDLLHRWLPSYLHPMVEPLVRDAFELAASLRGTCEYEDQAWRERLARAREGEIVEAVDSPYTPEWIFATDRPYELELAGRTWSSIDDAVAHAMARPERAEEWAQATLKAALEWKHREDFVPAMVLKDTGDEPIIVPSRWDAQLGDNVVGRMLMQIRAAHATEAEVDEGADDMDDGDDAADEGDGEEQ